MPSSKIKQPGGYPKHWEAALVFLTKNGPGTEVLLEQGLNDPRLNTAHTKARAMRISCQRYEAWGDVIVEMARAGAIAFRIEATVCGNNLYVRKKHNRVWLP